MRQYILPIAFVFLGGLTSFAQTDSAPNSRAVLFVIDKSGSMDGQKIADAKTSAKAASREALKRGARVGVLTFSGSCSGSDMLVLPFTSGQANVDKFIDRIDTGGGTPLAPAIEEAARIFRGQGINKDSAITVILADGDDDCGGVDGALAELKNHNFLNRHETVGLEVSSGSTAQRQLEQIANATGGTYQASTDSTQLEQILVNAVTKSVLLDMVGKFKPSGISPSLASSASSQNDAAAKLRAKANNKKRSGSSAQTNNKTVNEIRKKFQQDKDPIDAQVTQSKNQSPINSSEKKSIKIIQTPLFKSNFENVSCWDTQDDQIAKIVVVDTKEYWSVHAANNPPYLNEKLILCTYKRTGFRGERDRANALASGLYAETPLAAQNKHLDFSHESGDWEYYNSLRSACARTDNGNPLIYRKYRGC